MKDRETVIEALQYMISENCAETQFDYTDDIEAAIAMLNEQEAELQKGRYYSDVFDIGYKAGKESIVRCKDCKHGSIYITEDVCGKTLIECNHPELGDNIAIHAWNWFCADGERRKI